MGEVFDADALKDLHEVGMYQFAQDIGLIPDVSQGAAGPDPRGRTEPGVLPATAFVNSPAQHIKQEPSTSYGNGPANPEVKQQASLINTAADVAVARAVQALHTARTRARYHAASPSSSDPSREEPPSKRARRSSKAGASTSAAAEAPSGKNSNKGLRHFSVKVCEKVESKGRTTYNEVADELVAEMSKVDPSGYEVPYDEKNIRRRVYDAINVLMAMNIIQKEKKEIIWNGYPNGAGLGLDTLRAEKAQRQQEVQRKAAYLQELIEQQQAIKQLLERNQDSCGAAEGTTALQLPFILVQARPDATVEVQISENMLDVQFDFYNSPFQIHDDSYVLRVMHAQQHLTDQARSAQAAQAAAAQTLQRAGSRGLPEGSLPPLPSSNGISRQHSGGRLDSPGAQHLSAARGQGAHAQQQGR